MLNAAKKCISKPDQDTPDSVYSVNTQVDVKPPQIASITADSHRSWEERPISKGYVLSKISRKEISSVYHPLQGSQSETSKNSNRKA